MVSPVSFSSKIYKGEKGAVRAQHPTQNDMLLQNSQGVVP